MDKQYEYALIRVRLIAMVYEGLLLSSITFIALIVASPFAFVLRDLPTIRTAVVGIILLAMWYWYFVNAWHKKEQTLAMKTWKITLKSITGQRATLKQLNLRFIWACIFLLLIPSLAYITARHFGHLPTVALILASLWWILPLGWSITTRERQFLYDFLAGTALWQVQGMSNTSREVTKK